MAQSSSLSRVESGGATSCHHEEPIEIRPSPLTTAEREMIIDWHRSGDYDRIVADLVTHDPDLATR